MVPPKSTAERITVDGQVTAYRINGSKQWISSGGLADAYTVPANAPAAPAGSSSKKVRTCCATIGRRISTVAPATPRCSRSTTFGVYAGAAGGRSGRSGAALSTGRVRVHPPDGRGVRTGGGVGGTGPGHPLFQGAHPGGFAGTSEKQGYTHKLIVPHAARLEAARACIENTAARLYRGRALNTGKARSPSTWRPSPETGRRKLRSRPLADTRHTASTWSRRSNAMRGSPQSTRYPPKILEMTISRDLVATAHEEPRAALP